MSSDNKKNPKPLHWARVGRSILNGVIGDYLEKENNPLAINMGFYHRQRRLILNDYLAHQVDFPLSNKVVVFVHGLTNLETIWDFPNTNNNGSGDLVDHYIDSYFDFRGLHDPENYGVKLQQEFSYTPLFLRYNTGLSVEKNARELSKLLNQLFSVYPIDIEDLMLVGFSMGGLLIRNAQHNALEGRSDWLESLRKCIYIGSPHEGAPLEKVGHITGEVFRQMPKSYVNHWADWIDLRSEGIKNLKHGLKFFGATSEDEVCESFVDGARHYFISGGMFDKNFAYLNKLIGDSLVRKNSAVPASAPTNSLSAHFEGIAHVPLAHSEQVYQQIKQWVADDEHKYRVTGEEETFKLCLYDPVKKPYTAENEEDVSTQALLAGAIDLLATGYDKTLETVETLHFAIADEPFAIAQRLPVVSQITHPIEKIHHGILDSVYRSLRLGGKIVHETAKQVAPSDKKAENYG